MEWQAMRALMVFALLGLIGRASGAVVTSNSFESGLGGWARGSDAQGVASFASGATLATTPAHGDHSSAVLNAEGNGVGGSVWLESALSVEPGRHRVTVSFWVYACEDAYAEPSMAIAAVEGGAITGASAFSPVRRIEPMLGWQLLRMTETVVVERGQAVRVGVGFQRASAATVKYAFDDVAVRVESVECAADVDRSGALTAQDVLAFVDAWFEAAAEGDFDRSGRIDTQDLFAFLNAWLAGC